MFASLGFNVVLNNLPSGDEEGAMRVHIMCLHIAQLFYFKLPHRNDLPMESKPPPRTSIYTGQSALLKPWVKCRPPGSTDPKTVHSIYKLCYRGRSSK